MVFAAASLRDVMLEQADEFGRLGGQSIAFNFAGSNVLALQLEASPRSADVFLSANAYWMDHLSRAEVVADASRVEFLSNRLVVVAGRDSPLQLTELSEIASPAVRFLAIGNPDAVPAGTYARAALESVTLEGGTLWQLVEARVAPAADARGALALVEARTDTLGIVYRTDASSSERARALLEIPASLTPPIVYSAAVLGESVRAAEAAAFVRFLASDQAIRIFERHGFEVETGVAHG
jgi:molybdate transport system substrate-binding protein